MRRMLPWLFAVSLIACPRAASPQDPRGTAPGFARSLRSYVYNEGGSQAGAVLFPIAVGAAAGLGLDALLARNRTVYVR